MPNSDEPLQQSVVTSPAMVAPYYKDALRERDYPPLDEPPAAHARLSGDIERGVYALNYAGHDILTIELLGACSPVLRVGSDGNFQSRPFIQQYLLACDARTPARATFRFPCEAVNMRPRRAHAGEAILGQVGHPLLHGVGGVYALDWDLLVEFHGLDFAWEQAAWEVADGAYSASLTLSIGARPWVVVLRPRYYGEHLGYARHKPWRFRPDPRPVAGWCSWEAYHDTVTLAHVREAARKLEPLRKWGLTHMQLDDGYQQPDIPPPGSSSLADTWLNTNEKFPGGHEAIAGAMREGGFVPGIWTNAVVNQPDFAREHCLQGPDGEPMRCDWVGYALTCDVRELREQVIPYYRALRERGYRYFKSDALRHLLFDGLDEAVRLGRMDSEEASRRQSAFMSAAREGIGEEAYFLSCWGTLTQGVGACDAMRVATDANPQWYSVSMQVMESARWFFAQRVLFTVDPDHVCVRAELPWVRMLLSLVSLSGGLYMISDQPEGYDETRLALIRRTLPALPTRAAETGPVDYSAPCCARYKIAGTLDDFARDIIHWQGEDTPFGSLWATHFDQGGRRWCVAQRCAVVPLPAVRLDVRALALDPARRYLAFDFWEQRALGCGSSFDLAALPLGETQVIGLYDVSDGRPRVVGSDRHVSMDAASIVSERADGERLTLTLAGFAGLRARYAIHTARRTLRVLSCEGTTLTLRACGEIAWLDVEFLGERASVALY